MKQTDLTAEDAADIGRAFMELLPDDFHWNECPTEYVTRLQDDRTDAIDTFAKAILHGDEKHRAWLQDAADRFIAGEPVIGPPKADDARVERSPVLPCLQPDATDSACKCCQRRLYRDEQSNVAHPQNGESNALPVVGKSTGDRTLGHERRNAVEEGSRGERGACRDELRASGPQCGSRAAGDEAGRSEVTEAGRGNSAPAGSAPVVLRHSRLREILSEDAAGMPASETLRAARECMQAQGADGPLLDRMLLLAEAIEVELAMGDAPKIQRRADGSEFNTDGAIMPSTVEAQASLANAVHQVYFRAGLIAAREYLARFVEPQDASIATSIRANWWPSLGPDCGPPRKLGLAEIADWDDEKGVVRAHHGPDVVTPTLEALPVAAAFLASTGVQSEVARHD